MKDGILLEVTNWGWKFENGDVVPTLAHQVILCYYYWYRRAILFLLFYGSPRILIFIGASCIVIILEDSLYPYYQVIKYEFCCSNYLNPFVPNDKFLYPLKKLEKTGRFSDVSKLYRNVALGRNRTRQAS